MSDLFRKFARKAAAVAGSPWAFLLAAAIVVVWALSGPFLGFSDVWQLTINTGTTIVTFLMVFLIQNAQNRDSQAVHLKLDELLRASDTARNSLLDLEDLSDDDLKALQQEFASLSDRDHHPLAVHANALSEAIGKVTEARAGEDAQP